MITAVDGELEQDLQFILTASGKQIEKKILGTPLKRAGSFGLRRNALIVTANLRLQKNLKQFVETLERGPSPW